VSPEETEPVMTSADEPRGNAPAPQSTSEQVDRPTIPTQPGLPATPPSPDAPPDAPPAGPGRGTVRLVVLTAVLAALVGAGVAAGVVAATDRGGSPSGAVSTTASRPSGSASPVTRAASVIGPSVVTINVAAASGAAGTGSGVILNQDGFILTNNHVVTLDSTAPANGDRISVTLADGDQVAATMIGTDPPDDLAVIRISGQQVAAATFAASSELVVGQGVVAVGAPLGLSNTVTSGIVSALDRPVRAGVTGEAIFDAIQTDAPINPGNSGGPLVDLAGHVVGINAAIATAGAAGGGESGNIGIGFAIPSDQAVRIAQDLITTGQANHAVLGVAVRPAAGSAGGGPTSGAGAAVVAVVAGGPAQAAGIRTDDVITAVGQQRIDDPVGLTAAVRSHAPGDTVSITLDRSGSAVTVKAKLAGSTEG